MSGFKLENFCANFHTVMIKKKMFIWKTTGTGAKVNLRIVLLMNLLLMILLTVMITQAGPKKLQMNSKFNQQLKCVLKVH